MARPDLPLPTVGALRKPEAAAYLSVSDETFDRWVRPYLPYVPLGTLRLYRVAALDAFAEAHEISPADDLAQRRRRAA